VLDPYSFLPRNRFLYKWVWETGALFLDRVVRKGVVSTIGKAEFDVVWVDGGELIGPALVTELKRRAQVVINYNHDDPFGSRDSNKWRLYLQSVPQYSLLAVVRNENISEAADLNAQKVLLSFRTADERAHAPRAITTEDMKAWGSGVSFVGTWMPERGPFLAELVRHGIPLSIWGDRWHKADEWPLLKRHWRGGGLYRDDDYAKAIQCSKVCLGLLSKGNRDLHTTRSLEIPYLGGLFCAERTVEHLSLYGEDEEAIFWNSAQECIEKCAALLRDDERRQRIARNGRERCIRNRTLNEPTL
jgi:hypothetical protein